MSLFPPQHDGISPLQGDTNTSHLKNLRRMQEMILGARDARKKIVIIISIKQTLFPSAYELAFSADLQALSPKGIANIRHLSTRNIP